MSRSAGVCVGVLGPVRDSCKGCGLRGLWSQCSHKDFISVLSNPPSADGQVGLGFSFRTFPLPLSFFVSFLFIKPPVQMDGSDRRGGSVCGDPAVMGNRWAGVSIIWHFLSGKSTCSACRCCNTVRVSDDLNSAPVYTSQSLFVCGEACFCSGLCISFADYVCVSVWRVSPGFSVTDLLSNLPLSEIKAGRLFLGRLCLFIKA